MAQPSHPSSTGLEEYAGRRHGALQHCHERAHERIRALIAMCGHLVADIYDNAISDVVVDFL